MGKLDRFVTPKTIRIDISEGDWIEIKRELNVGERKRAHTAGMTHMHGTEEDEKPEIKIDMLKLSFAKVREYLVDWSFAEPSLNKDGVQITGKDGKPEVVPVELTEDAIRNLDEATFEEITKAIDEHEEALEKEKKATTGRSKSAQI